MRTQQRDQLGQTVFSGRFDCTSATSGAGVAGSVPFTWSRIASGQYAVRFDSALTPLAVTMGHDSGSIAAIFGLVPGAFSANTFNTSMAAYNGIFSFTVTARDARR